MYATIVPQRDRGKTILEPEMPFILSRMCLKMTMALSFLSVFGLQHSLLPQSGAGVSKAGIFCYTWG